ncbi:mechanosensitive ion channel domain-containing protein [Mucilaginibacter arboris]|uniref:Mechanosensitive ion channel n=1 Tax=Mucilaginibacter arboris TaxID=2682090 RepID=A0A7K1SX41_9SPHI|nr:mechanosensitive ion channel domain-containing protein [Mucilaginibacter arboris]MVN21905.1 mechanosensitive ion channel [Mucilaginibacter arboris]
MPYCFYNIKISKAKVTLLLLIAFSFFFAEASIAQKQKKTLTVQSDSLKFALKYRDSLLHKAKKSDTSINHLLDKIEYYTAAFNEINSALAKGIDTLEISNGLPRLERGIKIVKETVNNNDKSSTLRYLYAVRDILTHIEDRLDDWQEKLSERNARLIKIQSRIQEFKSDSSLNYIPSENALQKQYLEQWTVLNTKFNKLQGISRQKLLNIGLLQNRVVQNYIKIADYKNQINEILDKFAEKAISKEYPYLWQSKPSEYLNSLSYAWQETLKMNKRLLLYFAISNYDIHLYGILLLAAFFYWVIRSLKKIRKNNIEAGEIFNQADFVPKHPFLSSLVVSCVITTFFYDHPPVIFVEAVMFILLISTGILLRTLWPKSLFRYWLLIVGLTIFYDISNLFIKVCYTDRIAIFLLSIICLVGCISFLKSLKKTDLVLPARYFLFLRIFMAMQVASLLLNLAGRFSIAKLLGVTALSGLWQAISLYVFVRVIMEAIFLHLEGDKSSDNEPSYFDYKTLQSRLQNIVTFITGIFWLIWMAENFNIIDFLVDFSTTLLTQYHTIGDTKFTFGNVLVFVIIIWIASALSKIITYFFEFADQHAVTTTRKNKLSSSILLVKLTIFGVGFLLAIIASSIPVEKINIIIGALSVGIGFGLQTIVNNLVSGVILAFEKPVQIGDVIEVGGHSGTIKEMGIRASKIATGDGSEIIVPNGDLLSQHLVNWTLSNNNRRVELVIRVAYGSELNKVRKLLYQLITKREDVMKDPGPAVLIQNFSDNAVDFQILFWVADLGKSAELKSRVLNDIYQTFDVEGIEIPFPQRNLHLHYPPEKETEKLPVKEAPDKDK